MNIKKAVILGNIKSPIGGPQPYSWFVLTYMQGLQLNEVDVVGVDYKSNSLQEIKQKIISIRPDVVFAHLSFHSNLRQTSKVLQMQRDIAKTVGCKFIHVAMDAYREGRYMGDISDSFYMAFVGNCEMLERGKKAWKIPSYYTPYSSLCYSRMVKPVKDLMFKEPVFTGLPNLHSDRANFLRRLQEKISVRIFQTQSGNDLRHRTPELSVSASSILGLCTGYDGLKYYMDVRPWQFLGTGACMIMRKFDGMDDIIPENLYYQFDSYDDDGVNKVIEHHKKILETDTIPMRERAFDFIQKYHNCRIRIRDILDVIEGKKEIGVDYYNISNVIKRGE